MTTLATITLGPGVHTLRLTASGGTATLANVAADPISSVTDTTSATDSNFNVVRSPASVAVTDSAVSSDTNACTVTRLASVSVPFMLAASFVLALLWDTATADTGSAADVVVISQTARQSDTATAADSVAVIPTVAVSDTATTSELVASAEGGFSFVSDSATVDDSVTLELVTRTSATDGATTSDAVGLEFVSPEALAIDDAASSYDLNSTAVSIGQMDGATSTDEAVGVIGLLSHAVDGANSTESCAASVSSAPPSNIVPVAAIADPIIVGVLADEHQSGHVADPITVGMKHER